jgi:superfamily II DNA/RNA helicase
VLVFCTTARVTALFAEFYKKLGMNTLEIHSRKSQSFRTKVSDEFRNHPGGVIMFTSDVSARGVDYPDVTLVLQVLSLDHVWSYFVVLDAFDYMRSILRQKRSIYIESIRC